MYPVVLTLHSWNRWLVVLALFTALGLAYRGWLGRHPYRRLDGVAGGVLIGALHLQLLLGMMLYAALSPWTQMAFRNWGAALQDAELRFWSVQHIGLMVSGVLVAQIGRSIAKRAQHDHERHRLSAIFFSLALGLILLGIPFASRPWFRF